MESEGLWSSIFGWRTLFRWDVLGALVPGVLLACGVGLMGIDWFPHNLLISQMCFGIAGVLCLAKTIGHAAQHPASTPFHKVLFCILICAAIVGLDSYVIWAIQMHKHTAEIPKAQPQIPQVAWQNPTPIVFGTPLTDKELNATSLVSGTYIYNPTFGTTLPVGTQTLAVTFTPFDTSQYLSLTKTVALIVNPPKIIPTSGSQSHPPSHPIIIENRTSVLHDDATRKVIVTVVLWNTGNADIEAEVSINLFWSGVWVGGTNQSGKRKVLFPAPSQRAQSGFLQEITQSGELTEDEYNLFKGENSPLTVEVSAIYLDGGKPTKFYLSGRVSSQNAFVDILETSRETIKQP